MTDWNALAAELLSPHAQVLQSEQRCFPRQAAPARTFARIIADRGGASCPALLKDLSPAGLGITLNRALRQGQYLVVELTWRGRVQKVLARVAHTTPLEDGVFRTGVEFIEELAPSADPDAPIPASWLAKLP